ncbi:hypothetical protein SCA6_011725 [Theobroma cacao]
MVVCNDSDGAAKSGQFMVVAVDTNQAVSSLCDFLVPNTLFYLCGAAENASNVDCVLNCDQRSISVCLSEAEAYLHLPIVNSKLDRFSLFNNLSSAVSFAKLNVTKGRTLLICCHDGEDISVCVCLAILILLFDDEGSFDGGKSFSETCITKCEMRRRLVYICRFAIKARPSRGNLKQVFSFLNTGRAA